MTKKRIFQDVALFMGLKEEELDKLVALATRGQAEAGAILIEQNTVGDDFYIIESGSVKVYIDGYHSKRSLVVLGKGQVFGEMSLVDHGYRSASVRATEEGCVYYLIKQEAIEELFEENKEIGYTVMRNLASDLAFKLRHGNLVST